MSSIESLRNKLDRMIHALPSSHEQHFINTPEWHAIHAIITQTIAAFPDAADAYATASAEIELIQPDWHTVQIMVSEALQAYLDARIALAEKLVSLS